MQRYVSDLPEFNNTRGDDLDVVGAGKVVGATVGPLRYRQLTVARRTVLSRKIRFVDCRFVGWRLGRAAFYGVSFERCVFEKVQMGWIHGVDSMIDCTVEGVFRALLSGPSRITGNDFSRTVGARFLDGVRMDSNKFAVDGSQLIVSRTHPNWPQVVARASSGDPVADGLVKTQRGKQAWSVLYLTETRPDDWSFYAEHFGAGAPAESSDDDLLPSFGHGQIGFTDATSDDEAWRRVQRERPEPLFDVQLTPSGLHLLGEVVGLPRSRTCTLVREDDARMLLRLHPDLIAALRAVTDQESVVRDWDEQVDALEEGEWADDPDSILAHLLLLAQRQMDGRLYAVLID